MKILPHVDNSGQKYANKLHSLMQFQLVNFYKSGMKLMVNLNIFILLFAYLVMHDYPRILATMDATFVVLSGIFFYIIKPKMLSGKIKAYYRRDYNDIRLLIMGAVILIQGALIRFPIIFGMLIFSKYLSKSPYESERYLGMMKQMLINPNISIFAVIFALVVLYFVFYNERYTSIKGYSNGVTHLVVNSGMHFDLASREYIRIKDKEYSNKFIRDFEVSNQSNSKKQEEHNSLEGNDLNNPDKCNEIVSEGTQKSNEVTVIRRQSRGKKGESVNER